MSPEHRGTLSRHRRGADLDDSGASIHLDRSAGFPAMNEERKHRFRSAVGRSWLLPADSLPCATAGRVRLAYPDSPLFPARSGMRVARPGDRATNPRCGISLYCSAPTVRALPRFGAGTSTREAQARRPSLRTM